jgi:hypothetical protein
MLKLETRNGRDWQGFSRILEIMSFVDGIEESTPEDAREAADELCDLPPNPATTMSLEEVVFWSGVAAGMDLERYASEEKLDPVTAEKILVFASLFGHSTKNAIVDLALGQIEEKPVITRDTGSR